MTNYSKMCEPNEAEESVVETVEPTVEETSTPEVHTTPEAKTVIGVVVDCARLNVRKEMSTSSKVLCVLPASTEVEVFTEVDYDDWYRVCTKNHTIGFCMKQYISVEA